jgi:ABC-type multidrug transport system fused ATPase/permease subunit
MFGVVTKFRGRLALSQALLFASALTTVLFATLTQGLVNQGIEAGDPERLLNIAGWMFVLALVAGLCMAGAEGADVDFVST